MRARAFLVALREERACQHQAAHARLRRRAVEEAQRLRRLDILDPQHRLGAAAKHREARPARIGGDEGEVALAAGPVAVAAQDDPFDELARRRVRDAGRDVGRLAGAALAQPVDCAFDQRDLGIGSLRRRPLRQRYLRHRGFFGRSICCPWTCPLPPSFRLAPSFRWAFAVLSADLAVAAGELLAPRRVAAASAARVTASRLAQASAATSADRSRRVKSACPQTPANRFAPAHIHAPALTNPIYPRFGRKSDIGTAFTACVWIAGRYHATSPPWLPHLGAPEPGANRTCRSQAGLKHDPEKACPGLDPGWIPVFGKDHAPTRSWSGMTI